MSNEVIFDSIDGSNEHDSMMGVAGESVIIDI
jgi:hypothetical protein